jgi:hypothetical protein
MMLNRFGCGGTNFCPLDGGGVYVNANDLVWNSILCALIIRKTCQVFATFLC